MSPNLFAAVVATSILVCVLAILTLTYLLLRVRHDSLLRRRVDPQASSAARDFGVAGSAPVIETMARSGKAIEQMVDTEGESGKLMAQAGWRSAKARLFWYAVQAALPIALFAGVIGYWVFSESKQRTLVAFMLLIVSAILSFLAPRWALRFVAGRRRQAIKSEVPLFIHLLVLLFESGLSTRQALASIVRESGGVLPQLGREFDLALRQVDAGAELGDTLRAMGETLEVEDLTTVLGVLRQVERYGGELREPLLDTLQIIEERRGFELRERVNLMSGRMTVVMVLFFFPALLIFIAGPAFMAIISALSDINAR